MNAACTVAWRSSAKVLLMKRASREVLPTCPAATSAVLCVLWYAAGALRTMPAIHSNVPSPSRTILMCFVITSPPSLAAAMPVDIVTI